MLKIAIIGSGFGRYGLLPAFSATPGCKVVAFCGKKTKVLVDDCKRFGLTNIYSDWRELLKSERLDAVAVAVTPDAQYEIIKAAIKKSLHVFAEKPLAIHVPQAQELLRLAKKKNIVHGIDFIFPEIESWKKVKELLDKKIYGELRHISVRWDFLSYDIAHKKNSWKTDSSRGGGALSFYFSHGLYYLEHFAGRISSIKSRFMYAEEILGGGEAGVDMLLTFENGVVCEAHVCCNTLGMHRHQLTFQCADAVIILENENSHVDGFTITVYSKKGTRKIRVREDADIRNQDPRVKVVKKLTKRFVESCKRQRNMHPSFVDGARVQDLIAKVRAEKID